MVVFVSCCQKPELNETGIDMPQGLPLAPPNQWIAAQKKRLFLSFQEGGKPPFTTLCPSS